MTVRPLRVWICLLLALAGCPSKRDGGAAPQAPNPDAEAKRATADSSANTKPAHREMEPAVATAAGPQPPQPPQPPCPSDDELTRRLQRSWPGPVQHVRCTELALANGTHWFIAAVTPAAVASAASGQPAEGTYRNGLLAPGGDLRWQTDETVDAWSLDRRLARTHSAIDVDGDGVSELLRTEVFVRDSLASTFVNIAALTSAGPRFLWPSHGVLLASEPAGTATGEGCRGELKVESTPAGRRLVIRWGTGCATASRQQWMLTSGTLIEAP